MTYMKGRVEAVHYADLDSADGRINMRITGGVKAAEQDSVDAFEGGAASSNITKTHTTTAIIRKAATKTHTATAVVRKTIPKTYTSDAVVRRPFVMGTTTDAVISKSAGDALAHLRRPTSRPTSWSHTSPPTRRPACPRWWWADGVDARLDRGVRGPSPQAPRQFGPRRTASASGTPLLNVGGQSFVAGRLGGVCASLARRTARSTHTATRKNVPASQNRVFSGLPSRYPRHQTVLTVLDSCGLNDAAGVAMVRMTVRSDANGAVIEAQAGGGTRQSGPRVADGSLAPARLLAGLDRDDVDASLAGRRCGEDQRDRQRQGGDRRHSVVRRVGLGYDIPLT